MSKSKKYSFLLILSIVAVCTFLFTQYIIHPFIVAGDSMEPTLHNGQYVFANVISPKVERFNIVCIDMDDKRIVKRLIGLPGEHLTYKDNQLYIDGKKYEEPYLKETYTENIDIRLNENEYYCLGDNRKNSKDSRIYGPFKFEQLYGKNIYKIN